MEKYSCKRLQDKFHEKVAATPPMKIWGLSALAYTLQILVAATEFRLEMFQPSCPPQEE